ncbi:eukaryotic translation initiation factor 3 subunit A-like [Zophobas morio]|uniref:eukaryotic translation initiation factor 3 subunit A-like n=1 Tax=Zophobas morio TaxID=2755281 RepID=UPI0030839AC0
MDYLEVDEEQEKCARRLTYLLGLSTTSSKELLLKELNIKDTIRLADSSLQPLYNWLELDFHPLDLCQRVSSLFDSIQNNEHYRMYAEPMKRTAATRALQQLAKVYETITISSLQEVIPFCSQRELHDIILKSVKERILQARINHRTQTVSFGADLFYSSEVEPLHKQIMQSSTMQTLLTQLCRKLYDACQVIDPSIEASVKAKKIATFTFQSNYVEVEREKLLARKNEIELRRSLVEAEYNQSDRYSQQLKERQLAEEHQKELQRISELKAQKEEEERLKLLEKLELERILKVQEEQKKLEKLTKEHELKISRAERRLDHFERAKRLIMIPKMIAERTKKVTEDKKYLKEQFLLRVERERLQHEKALLIKANITKMLEAKDQILNSRKVKEEQLYLEKLQQNFKPRIQKVLLEKREQRLQQKREEEERLAAQKRKEKEEKEARKKREEALEKERQAREAKARLEEEQKRLEEEAKAREQSANEGKWETAGPRGRTNPPSREVEQSHDNVKENRRLKSYGFGFPERKQKSCEPSSNAASPQDQQPRLRSAYEMQRSRYGLDEKKKDLLWDTKKSNFGAQKKEEIPWKRKE